MHALAVSFAIEAKGHSCEILSSSDLPTRSCFSLRTSSASPSMKVSRIAVAADSRSMSCYDTVWLRRQVGSWLPPAMHEGDRIVAKRQCDAFINEVIAAIDLTSAAFYVNNPKQQALAWCKSLQLDAASKSGLMIPDTLITNDPKEIRSFLSLYQENVILKLLRPANWRKPTSGDLYGVYTSRLTTAQLPNDRTLRLCPYILQPYLDKAFEVRVSCLGSKLIAVAIRSQDDSRAAVDWRAGQHHVSMEAHVLPDSVASQCRALMVLLGLEYGALDFIVDLKGNYVFLEVNEQGQFLWMEDRAGVPILDAFANFLIAGSTAVPPSHVISLADFLSHDRQQALPRQSPFTPPDRFAVSD